MKMIKMKVMPNHQICRIDLFIYENWSNEEKISRSRIQKLIAEGNVFVNGNPVSKKQNLKTDDEIEIRLAKQIDTKPLPQNISLHILYEDDDVVVTEKPQGMVVHPGAGKEQDTLLNALLYRYGENGLSDIGGEMRKGIVHRLDKDTGGVVLVAKNNFSHENIAAQFKNRTVFRQYDAVVVGLIKEDSGTLNLPIARHEKKRKQMCVSQNGREAITDFEVIARYNEYKQYTHVRLSLKTGRTHQIRVHLAHAGHPVVGDMVYANKHAMKSFKGVTKQVLHASALGFVHPRTKKAIFITSELPDLFNKYLASLGGFE